MTASSQDDRDADVKAFQEAVNMTPAQIEKWLTTDESQKVGQKKNGEGESVGHKSGQHIIEILCKKKADYTEADIAHMRKVISYVHRHLAQKPSGDVSDTHWRYSLMNWGHDPLKG